MMVTSSYQGTRLLFWLWPDLTYATGFIVYFLSIVGLTFWMFMFVACQLETVIRRWVRYAVYIFNAAFIILLLILPIDMVSHLVVVLVIQNVAVYSYSLVILLRSFRGGDPVAGHRFLAFLCLPHIAGPTSYCSSVSPTWVTGTLFRSFSSRVCLS